MRPFITCTIIICCVSHCFAGAPSDLNDIYAKWKANYASMKINKMKWCVTLLECKKSAPPAPEANMVPLQIFYKELIKDGNNVSFRYCVDTNDIDESPNTMTYIFDGKTTKHYDKPAKTLAITAGTSSEAYKVNEALECMLLMPKFCPPQARCSKYALEDFFQAGIDLKDIKLSPNMETILDYPCYVVEFTPTHKAWFAPDLGMLPLKYYQEYKGFVFTTVDVQRVASIQTAKGPWWYAELSIYKQATRDHGEFTHTVQVLNMEPNYPVTKKTFNPKWPNNTKVVDRINNVSYVIGINDINQLQNVRKLKK
jgi:hypothetical protein